MSLSTEPLSRSKRDLTVSMGPQHPATHGVLRLTLELEGETIIKCSPSVGFLHRGAEKLAEHRTYLSILPLTDRLDYISGMLNNQGYSIAIERMIGIEVPERAKYIRTITAEMSRISSHLLWLGTHALDIGAMTVLFLAFRDRERILDLFEILCGARLTTSYLRIGGVKNDVPQQFVDALHIFTREFPGNIREYETLIDMNRVWLKRTKGIGVISPAEALNWGLSGPTLRGSGVAYDVRKFRPYDAYGDVEFEVPVGKNGDVYDRYRCRMQELTQSNRIIAQCLEKLSEGPILAPDMPKFILPPKEDVLAGMEAMIRHFVLLTKGPIGIPQGEIYSSVEGAKGELGFYIISDGSGNPYRLKIRAPSFVHASYLPRLCEGGLIADAIANIGTIDIVLGECDR